MEPMDYYSDSEPQLNVSHSSNSENLSMNMSGGYSIQGVLDAAASMTAQISQMQESGHDSLQDMVGEMCKPYSSFVDQAQPAGWSGDQAGIKPHSLDPRPCPECGRIYSNISNLRQHIRLIHNPECITCPLCFKPFKNKLYLRRHVMSFHEINLPSQNDLRYKYANLIPCSSAQKNDTPDAHYNAGKLSSEKMDDKYANLIPGSSAGPVTKNHTPDAHYNAGMLTQEKKAAMYRPLNSALPHQKFPTDKMVPMLSNMRRAAVENITMTDNNVPSTS